MQAKSKEKSPSSHASSRIARPTNASFVSSPKRHTVAPYYNVNTIQYNTIQHNSIQYNYSINDSFIKTISNRFRLGWLTNLSWCAYQKALVIKVIRRRCQLTQLSITIIRSSYPCSSTIAFVHWSNTKCTQEKDAWTSTSNTSNTRSVTKVCRLGHCLSVNKD